MKLQNQKGITPILIILVIVGALIAGGGFYFYKTLPGLITGCTKEAKICPDGSVVGRTGLRCEFSSCPETKDETAGWKTYKNDKFEFKYSNKLTLKQEGEKIILNHSIPYENSGCDMSGSDKTYPSLTDLSITFDLRSGTVNAPYVDGEYSRGNLSGNWAYEGVEGCGPTVYYFPLSGDNTLVVSKEIPQQLSGAVASEFRDRILKVPGAISSQKSDFIFNQILSTFKFTK